MQKYDAIIIGAGHNGLVCATYLAKSGLKVLIVESAEQVGGMAASREFFPGFSISLAHTLNNFSSAIARELELDKYGLEYSSSPLDLIGLDSNAAHVRCSINGVSGVNDADTLSYSAYSSLLDKFSHALRPFWHRTMPDVGFQSLEQLMTFGNIAWNLRRLGRDDMREFFRIIALPPRDLVDEFFENDLLKATLCWDALTGSRLAPRSPNNGILSLLYRMSGNIDGKPNSHLVPRGSLGGFMDVLCNAARTNGVEIRTGVYVDEIVVAGNDDGLKATGVRLRSGELIGADTVISNADPKTTFLKLVGVENLQIEFSQRIKRIRSNGLVAKLHLALDSLPSFKGLDKPDGRLIVAPNMDAIEFAFDDAKYGEFPGDPVMEIVIPSLFDDSLAPKGKHVLSAQVMYIPLELKSGLNDSVRKQLFDRLVDKIEEYAPGTRDILLHGELLAPADIEDQYGVAGGHWHHGELALDQMLMMRPTYEAAQYATPIQSLYLCGAGSHPGGGVTGAPGHNAAKQLLSDLNRKTGENNNA